MWDQQLYVSEKLRELERDAERDSRARGIDGRALVNGSGGAHPLIAGFATAMRHRIRRWREAREVEGAPPCVQC